MFCKTNSTGSALLLVLLTSSCSVIKHTPRHQLSDGHYILKERGKESKKVFIQSADDSLVVFHDNKLHETPLLEDSKFIKTSLDVDIVTAAFKYRPSASGFPRQLTNDFNGSVFFGYRIDRFEKFVEQTPAGIRRSIRHRAMTAGLFGGIGSTFVSPWTTQNRTLDEYNALILSRGLAVMVGVNSVTVGVGAGWDVVTDRDKNIWIYQNKPWYGVTVGLSIN